MSECRLWWRSGSVQWCDMMGKSCRCGGWDEGCDMKLLAKRRQKAQEASQVQIVLAHDARKAKSEKYKRAA